jgi:uncharacterized membrane protein
MSTPQDELESLRSQLAALTARVYQLERSVGTTAAALPSGAGSTRETNEVSSEQDVTVQSEPAPPPLLPAQRIPNFAVENEAADLEDKIGKVWFNRIGILALLIGVSYFIKYAFDSGWIGPAGRIAVGLVAGIGLVLWSERFRNKGFTAFSYSLKAVGIGTLYLSLWGAFQLYHLIPSAAAFVAMVAVTASTIVLALTQDAEILASFALIGGFSTPILLSTGENHEVVLFSYVALLDLAVLAIIKFKPWYRLLIASFIGTLILYMGWGASYYTDAQRGLTVFYVVLFAAIFAVSPLLVPLDKSRWRSGFSITFMLLPLANAAALFLALFGMYNNERVTLTWYALALAAIYLALSGQFKRRAGSDPEVVRVINLLHVAIAIAFVTIAIPLKLSTHWITIGWMLESAVLLFIGVRTRTEFLRYFAVTTLTLGVVRLLFLDNFQVDTLVFNPRFETYLVALAILGGIVAWGSRSANVHEAPFVKLAGVLFNVLALVALTLEASDYFGRQIGQWHQSRQIGVLPLQQIEFSRHFSYSAIWLAYGACLMTFGFWRRSAFVRWQALALIAFTIGKVFLFDVSALQQGYRVLSFIGLGVVLMAISYVYHRGWLKLTSGSRDNSGQRTSA